MVALAAVAGADALLDNGMAEHLHHTGLLVEQNLSLHSAMADLSPGPVCEHALATDLLDLLRVVDLPLVLSSLALWQRLLTMDAAASADDPQNHSERCQS